MVLPVLSHIYLVTSESRARDHNPESIEVTADLDTRLFGHFRNITKPYREAGRKEIDKAAHLETLAKVKTAPLKLLDEAARIQANLSRLRLKPEKRLQLTEAITGQVYPVVAMWYEKFFAQESSLPESNERRTSLEASIKAIEQIAISYKLLFQNAYSTEPGSFGRHREELSLFGLRILELLRLTQRLKALRYQKVNKADWADINQVFFSMLLHNAVDSSGYLLGTVGVRNKSDKNERGASLRGTMQGVYKSIQLFGLLETNSWPTTLLHVPDAFLGSLDPDSFRIVRDDNAPLKPGFLVTYLYNSGPPQFQRREDIKGPSILIEYSGLYNALTREHENIAKMKFLGMVNESRLSKPMQSLSDEERIPVLESMLMGLTQRTRKQKRHNVHTYDTLRVYFGRSEVTRLLRDLSSSDMKRILDSRQFIDKLARQSSLLSDDEKSHMKAQWSIVNFSSGGILISTEETAFSTPIKIGQLVAFGPVDAELSKITLGYVNRLQRTDDQRVEVAILRLSTRAEAVVVQSEKDIQEKTGHVAILVRDLYNKWQLIVTSGLTIKSGDPLKLIRNDGAKLPVRLGNVWLVKKGFTMFELRSPGLQ